MPSHTQDAPNLQHYLHVLRRRKWIVLQAVVLAPLAAVVLALNQQHLYRASAEVWLSTKDLSVIATDRSSPYVNPERLGETSAELARVPAVATAALKSAELTDRSPADLLANSSVRPKTNADLLVFSVKDPVPLIAARLATAYARAYILYRHRLDTAQLKRAEQQVTTQIKQLESVGNTKSPLYLTLLQKQQQLQAIEALLTPPILTRPAAPGSQVQPRPLRNAVLGLLLGLLLGLGLAFLRDSLDTRVRSADEIGERLDLPLLARLPAPPSNLKAAGKLSMLEEPDSIQSEAFRVLRTNLEFVNIDRGAQIIMVTSALEAEGKSTTVANLAVAFARAGRRVIAVDLDLRRPLLDKLLGVGKRPGLTQVALGQLPLEDALVPITVSDPRNLSVSGGLSMNGKGDVRGILELLPAGPVPPDVGEFVGSRVLTDMLERLRQMADIILIDSPPLLRVGDAMTLSGKVDGIVIATSAQSAQRPLLKELRRVIESCPAERLGFVLTGVEHEDGYAGTYYGYGYPSEESRPTERELEREREDVGVS